MITITIVLCDFFCQSPKWLLCCTALNDTKVMVINQKHCSTSIKSCLIPLFLPILNTLLSRSWTNTRQKSVLILSEEAVFKLHAKKKEKKNSVWFICSSHFQTEDPEEVSRGLVCPWRQKFSLICTIPTNWSPQKQCKCFLWQAFKRIISPKEAVLILLPAWVPALRCVSTSSCAWQTGSRNWSTGNVFFSLAEVFFQRDHFPSGWEEHWMPFFFSLPPSPTPPASVGLVPTLTQGLNSTENLKKKN